MAGQSDLPSSQEALEKLCRAYWLPIYVYVRRQGSLPHEAQDLTQEFFARLLEKNYPAQADRGKGKFRSFLLTALNHFLIDQRAKANTQKRGGGREIISIDAEQAEERYRIGPADELTPEKVFERRWAQTILDRAVNRLCAEFVAEGEAAQYEVLRHFQPGEQGTLSYGEAAKQLHVSESAFKSMVHRLRQRHQRLIRDEIAQTVTTAAEIEQELRHLIAVISS